MRSFSKFALAVNLFQFVSMAGGEKIQWPQILLDVYESMSFWNLNMCVWRHPMGANVRLPVHCGGHCLI